MIDKYTKNRECPQFLGVHIAERVLSRAFKNVEWMPQGHRGFDIICNHGKKIDVKSSCIQKNGGWHFNINQNKIADYFLCLAFDNRDDLTPLYAWLIPCNAINHVVATSIRQSTLHKWDEYKIDISKILKCCDVLRK